MSGSREREPGIIEMGGGRGGFQRYASVQPGFDCLYSPCLHCPPQSRPGEHGIGCETHFLFVTFGDRLHSPLALSLLVTTSLFPETVPDHVLESMPPFMRWGDVVTSDVHVRAPPGSDGYPCEMLGGPCHLSGDHVMRLFERKELCEIYPVVLDELEQSEEVWRRLEARFERLLEGVGERV